MNTFNNYPVVEVENHSSWPKEEDGWPFGTEETDAIEQNLPKIEPGSHQYMNLDNIWKIKLNMVP
jgi:hypothetical protein